MSDPADLPRLLGDIVRLATVESVDRASATCRVRVGEIVTGDLPWLAWAAGGLRVWSPPTVGEQVVLLCAEADTRCGIVLPGLFSTEHPAPAQDGRTVLLFADGTKLAFDPDTHAIEIVAGGNGTLRLVGSGGIRLEGPVTITEDLRVSGKVDADGDVTGQGKSLATHRHLGVQSGAASSGPPQ